MTSQPATADTKRCDLLGTRLTEILRQQNIIMTPPNIILKPKTRKLGNLQNTNFLPTLNVGVVGWGLGGFLLNDKNYHHHQNFDNDETSFSQPSKH